MQIRFGDFVLDTDTRELTRDSRAVHLSPKAFQLLAVLVTARPRALSKETLYQHLWPNTFVVDANLSNLLERSYSNVPRKLSRASNHPGETLTLDEQTFDVKGKYERVFAPNA